MIPFDGPNGASVGRERFQIYYSEFCPRETGTEKVVFCARLYRDRASDSGSLSAGGVISSGSVYGPANERRYIYASTWEEAVCHWRRVAWESEQPIRETTLLRLFEKSIHLGDGRMGWVILTSRNRIPRKRLVVRGGGRDGEVAWPPGTAGRTVGRASGAIHAAARASSRLTSQRETRRP